jgi:hypothetical protein
MYEVTLEDFTFDVLVVFFAPGTPAKIDALPEDCYPEEPYELDWKGGSESEALNSLIDNCLSEKYYQSIEEQVLEQIYAERED